MFSQVGQKLARDPSLAATGQRLAKDCIWTLGWGLELPALRNFTPPFTASTRTWFRRGSKDGDYAEHCLLHLPLPHPNSFCIGETGSKVCKIKPNLQEKKEPLLCLPNFIDLYLVNHIIMTAVHILAYLRWFVDSSFALCSCAQHSRNSIWGLLTMFSSS